MPKTLSAWPLGPLALLLALPGCEPPRSTQPLLPPGVRVEPDIPESAPKAEAIGEGGLASSPVAEMPAVTEEPLPSQPVREPIQTASGLQIAVYREGEGEEAKVGDNVKVHYTGRLRDTGKIFDSSRRSGAPIPVTLGAGRVIKGWEEGIPGMKLGERRMLTIPPDLAYGQNGFPPDIPPNAVLEFDVQLVGLNDKVFTPPPPPRPVPDPDPAPPPAPDAEKPQAADAQAAQPGNP